MKPFMSKKDKKMITMDLELKPCPFCGREPRTNIRYGGSGCLVFSVKCDYCHTSRDYVKEIINMNFDKCVNIMNKTTEMWNERV